MQLAVAMYTKETRAYLSKKPANWAMFKTPVADWLEILRGPVQWEA